MRGKAAHAGKPHTRALVLPRGGNPDTWADNDMFPIAFAWTVQQDRMDSA
jgi:hypothetical protein